MLPKTVQVWTEAFATKLGRMDEELDAPRIKAAFKEARPELTTWPMPKEILELMPRRPEVKRIPFTHSEGEVGDLLSDTLNRILNKEITAQEGEEILRKGMQS